MKRNVAKTAHAKGLALLLAAGMLVSQMSGVSADAKEKKPKLSRTKVSVTVGKTKRVTVKNAKKVTWKVTKKAAQIVKLTKKSKKGATIKGLKKGTAKISVQMKNGKKKVKKTITVKVSSAKKVVVTAEPAKTTNKPTNGPTNGPTKEPVKEPTATPTATSTTEPSATPAATPTEEPSATPLPDLVLEGDDLGAGASYAYVPNGFAAYASMGIFEIDKSKLSEGTTISIKYTAMEGDTDVKDTQGFNIGLKTGDKWNSPTIHDYWGKTGGEANLTLTAADMEKIGADDKVYVHVSTATAGFNGTFTYLWVKAGDDSLVSELPQAVSYVESGLPQYAPTAKVMLPSDIDFNQYSKCQIKFTASDPTFEFHGIVGHKVNGAEVTDPKYGVTSEGYFEVNLSNVKQEEGTEPFVVINAGKAGYTGSVTINKITFVK
ncbi:MAG: PT domain-containing protein [Clostridium sp.]|nr:PT domain-containing protein [Clostridium sp.]